MRIFLSSVRRGLETERDALPGLIRALGHECSRFEDFTAQTTPRREACLRGVAEADVYLLLLGPHYGTTFPDTGQSPTHDEWRAAVAKGMPRMVFRKTGVDLDPEQAQFVATVGAYGSGVFYKEFADVAVLQTAVVASVRELESAPSALAFQPREEPVAVQWRSDWLDARRTQQHQEPWLELHVIDVGATPRPARVMREVPSVMIDALRSTGLLGTGAGVDTTQDGDGVSVEPAAGPSRRVYGEAYTQDLRGFRTSAAGQVSLWWSLPGDGMGSILDPAATTATVARGMRTVGASRLAQGRWLGVAVGLGGSLTLVCEGTAGGPPRSSARMTTLGSNGAGVRVEPDELVSPAALDAGADEVAKVVVDSLLERFRRR